MATIKKIIAATGIAALAVLIAVFIAGAREEQRQRFSKRYTVTLYHGGQPVKTWSAREKPRYDGASWGGSTLWHFWTDTTEIDVLCGAGDSLVAE